MKPSIITAFLASVILVALFSSTVFGTRHIVRFGGSIGDDYEPETLKVNVGDTILWLGNFSKHPLTLTKAPAGAGRFKHVDSGESFQYVVTVPGDYEYQCDKHVDMGMEGSFTAIAVGTKFERFP